MGRADVAIDSDLCTIASRKRQGITGALVAAISSKRCGDAPSCNAHSPRSARCRSTTGQVSQLRDVMYGQFRTCLPKAISDQMPVPRAKLHRNHEARSVGSHKSRLDGVADGYSVRFRSVLSSDLQLQTTSFSGGRGTMTTRHTAASVGQTNRSPRSSFRTAQVGTSST
jgi:hypothetical protein